jgi:hypothetical protein
VAVTRLITIALACALAVLGVAFVLERRSAPATVAHTCSPPDRQFLAVAHSNMTQLGFWSDQLGRGEAAPSDVAHEALAEAVQIGATQPVDPTLAGVRTLLEGVLDEYGAAIEARAAGRAGDAHMRRSWLLAAEVQDQLAAVQPQLAPLGCDVSPLLGSA